MSQAQTTTSPKAPKAAVILAPVTPDTARTAATKTAKAVVSCEKAKRTLLGAVAEAVAAIGCPLTASQYDRQFKPYLAAAFAVEVKRGAISEKTATQYATKLKTAVLALLCGVAQPVAGETFWEFYDRAAPELAKATVPQGDTQVPVWEASKKRGAKAGVRKGAGSRKGGAVPGPVADANASGSAADSGEAGFNRSPKMAAALILCNQNEARARRVVEVLASYAEQFDRWSSELLRDARKSEKPAAGVTVIPEGQKPATALAAAMGEAEKRKANLRKAS